MMRLQYKKEIIMLYNYSVTPLKEDNFEERVRDIVQMHKDRVITMPLFNMTLVPEGNPVWDKATKMCELYAKYKKALDAEGVPSGILIQASMGHGYVLTPNPFLRYVNLSDGKEEYVCCPEDDAYIEHFSGVVKQLASEHPAAIMLDDDIRLAIRPGWGCACHKHMAEFNRLAGTNMSREELYEYLTTHPADDRLCHIYYETQKNSLMKAVTAFRKAIDDVDPTIQGINCTSGHFCDTVVEDNKIFAGKGNPTIVRVPNGIYAPRDVRGFSDTMRQAAICASKLRKGGIDIILAETDTIPFNRYAKSARYLHSHFAASMLEGLKGAKHWLSRGSAAEFDSGKAYRKILAKHVGMYERLAELSDGLRWVGCNSAFVEQRGLDFNSPSYCRYLDNYWASENIERMGLPFYFSDNFGPANFVEKGLVEKMTDAQIADIFKGSVFLDGYSAKALQERGYGDLLGVSVSEWELGNVHGESFDDECVNCCTKQNNLKLLTVTNENTEVLSFNYRNEREGNKNLAPAVTRLKRADGVYTVVFCGSPLARFKYYEGFAFLNETRKKQFVGLLSDAGALPVYAVGDDELCLRAGYLADESLLVSIYDIGVDPMDSLRLFLEKEPSQISMIMPDGSDAPVSFEAVGNNIYELDVRVEPMYPVMLIIK